MIETWILLALAALNFILILWLLLRKQPAPDHSTLVATLGAGSERIERELRHEIGESSRGARQETAQAFATFQQALVQQGAESTRTQNAQIDAFAQQLTLLQKTLADTLNTQLQGLSESNARRLAEVRATMETQLAQLQQSNTAKLDEMRKTVDEKLQSTLEARLGESFKQVADRLEQVHKGLGEMQTLAVGVGSLQRVLTNVKTRGVFGEVQLEALLEQVLTPDQYAKQVETKPRSGQRVDFAIRFPGRGGDGAPVWLPIDAKFPRDDYERLLDAHERADPAAAELAAKALEARIRSEARSIAENYLAAPHTTDFAILFLPVESLYAEVLRRPGLMDAHPAPAPRDARRADHAAGDAQQPAHGLSHAGAGAAGLRGVEGAGRGQDRVRALRRMGRAHQGAGGEGLRHARQGRHARQADAARAAQGRGAARGTVAGRCCRPPTPRTTSSA